MGTSFTEMLAVGGKSNSLGQAKEVVNIVLADKSRLDELYDCLFEEDAWLRMRAIDSLEKICRLHPEWLEPYTDKLLKDLTQSSQPSIQWHLAEIFAEVGLTADQKQQVISWLKQLLSTAEVDWIASANSMKTLAQFTHDGSVSKNDLTAVLQIQQKHKSNAVKKRAAKLPSEF